MDSFAKHEMLLQEETIKLLNGQEWSRDDLLKQMDDDSFYYGFLGRCALSSSSLKKLLQSPKAYYLSLKFSESHQAFRDGRLIHLFALEPEKTKDLIVTEGTKARKEFKDAVVEHGDQMVYTESEMRQAKKVAEAMEKNSEVRMLLSDMDFEVPGIGVIDGIPFRAKADAISKDRKLIVDLKTTNDIYSFPWSAKKYKYALQAELYKRIFGADEFIFLVIDKGTLDIGIYDCSDSFFEEGARDLSRGIETYKEHFYNENFEELLNEYVIRGIL